MWVCIFVVIGLFVSMMIDVLCELEVFGYVVGSLEEFECFGWYLVYVV